MENAKEFEGKNLDEAIGHACAYFDAPREKLEIDIIQDAKSGIFGLVGSRKAVIQASPAPVAARVGDLFTVQHAPPPLLRQEAEAQIEQPQRPQPRPARNGQAAAGHPPRQAGAGSRPPRQNRNASRPQESDADIEASAEASDRPPYVPAESLNQPHLLAAVEETAGRLIHPIVPDARIEVEVEDGRVAVHIRSDEDLGLLIGREGQTLACLQYLAARIVARKVGSPVRLQFDAGDYRERQDEKLRELALALAERAKATGRVCPTRPLSSYQRRIVHLALQDDPEIQTRSSGEGPLKRVVIQKVRSEQ